MTESNAPLKPLSVERYALGAALLTLAGSLYLSMGMGLNACPLCFYQRTFIMGVVGVLGMGMLFRVPVPPGTLSLLALPLALSGLGVAAVHSYLVWSGFMVCPGGLFGSGPAPLQSLVAFTLVTALLLPGALQRAAASVPPVPRVGAVALFSAALVAFSLLSSPKAPPFSPKYDEAGNRILKGCERAAPEAPAPAPS